MQRVVQARYEAKKAVFDEIDDKLFAVNDDDIWKVLADIRKKHLRD